MKNKTHIAIIGATSGIAQQCARLWLQDQLIDFSLVGRSKEKLERLANDLQVRRADAKIEVFETDFTTPKKIQQTVHNICARADVDIVLIAHGNLPSQSACQDDIALAADTLNINGISAVLFAEAFAKHMENNKRGKLAVIGSVAGDRGRKSNYIYGAAKGLVANYMQGLQHRFAGTGVDILLIKPGPTDTPMTAELKSSGAKLASVEQVAKDIIAGIDKGRAEIYTPQKWWLIMMIIRHLPRFIFHKMDI